MTENQKKMQELCADMPKELAQEWHRASVAMGGGLAVKLLEATKQFYGVKKDV